MSNFLLLTESNDYDMLVNKYHISSIKETASKNVLELTMNNGIILFIKDDLYEIYETLKKDIK
jgi:hypothetical protein